MMDRPQEDAAIPTAVARGRVAEMWLPAIVGLFPLGLMLWRWLLPARSLTSTGPRALVDAAFAVLQAGYLWLLAGAVGRALGGRLWRGVTPLEGAWIELVETMPDPGAIAAHLQARGFTHVLVSWDDLDFLLQHDPRGRLLRSTEFLVESFIPQCLELVYENRFVSLYRWRWPFPDG